MKICPRCGKPGEFNRSNTKRSGFQSKCRVCTRQIAANDRANNPEKLKKRQADYNAKAPWRNMLRSARARARERGVPFSITMTDLEAAWPKDGNCPVLGTPLVRNVGFHGGSDQSPSLDASIPSLGYVPGNVRIISLLANRVKQDVTDPTILEKIAHYMRTIFR
jgi:hypothetical protein